METQKDADARLKDAVEALFPGRVVRVDEKRGITAIVYPPGLSQIRQFSRDVVSGVLTVVGLLGDSKTEPDKRARTLRVIKEMVPYVMSNLLDMTAQCTRLECRDAPGIRLEHLPHWLLPPIVQAWVEESFDGEEKIRPWRAAMEAASRKAGVDLASTLTSVTPSRPSSPPGTPGQTSRSTASQGAPTPAGASSS